MVKDELHPLSRRERAGVRGLCKSDASLTRRRPHPSPLPKGEGIRVGVIAVLVLLANLTSRAQGPTTKPVDYGAESYRVVSAPDEIVSVLNNGLTVIIKRVPSPVLAVRAYAQTGGVYEGKWLGGGLSHLLEHLVAGGTNERRTEEQNRNLLQSMGNDSNAYTTTDHTCFYVNTTPDHLNDAVDLIAGWMLGAKITPAEYAREYEVVQRELEMNKGMPDSVFWKLSQQNRYRVSPQRVPVVGYQEVIQGLSRDDVYGYYKLAYQPNNLVFAVAGDLDPEKMLAAVRKNVADAKPGREFSHELPAEPPVLNPRTVVATFPKLGQARLELGFPSVREDDPDMYPLDLLATVLGTGESSILVEELRDKRRLVSGVGAGDYTPSYVEGTFTVSMELDTDKIDEATKAALDIIEKTKTTLIDDESINRAKTQLRAQRLKGMQTSEDIIASMAMDYMSTGDTHFGDHYVQRIEAVTAQQMQDAAKKYLDRGRLITTALLPAEAVGAGGLPKAEDLLRPQSTAAQPKAVVSSAGVTRVELPNGIVLLHKRIATTPLIETRMYSLGGLTAEDEKTNGLGNLTMEMIGRGTKTRPADKLAEFFDSIGGDFDAGCGTNSWFWNMTCMKDDFAKAIEVYADIVNNPSFPEDELTGVKQRILAGIESQDADWLNQAMRFFKKSYFGPLKSPYQFMPVGQKEIVAQATAAQLQQWYQSKVIKPSRVIAIYGDIDLAQAQALATKYLAVGKVEPIKSRNIPAPDRTAVKGTPSALVSRVEVQKTDQALAGIVIGYTDKSVIGSPENFPTTVADTMTSGYGYPSGYLFETLRGQGLVYDVQAFDSPGQSADLPGAFIVYAGCDPRNVNQCIDLILENIARCQGTDQDMQKDWFDRSKQLITTGDAMENETPAQQATQAALDELYGMGYDYHSHFADRINAVTIDQVRDIAARRLRECVITVSTPAPELVKRETGVRTYQSFPPIDLTPRGVQHDVGK